MSKKHRLNKRADETSVTNAVDKKDKSNWVYQDSVLKTPVDIRCRYRLTERQNAILEVAADKGTKVVMIDGYWGTSKSMLSVLASLKLMNEKKLSGIVYIRNLIESTSSGKVGLLPGSLEERTAPYNAILFDKLSELIPKADVDRLKKEERIECIPVSFLQGKTFNRKAIIIDEAASMSYEDLLLAISRVGEHCKVFIIGDSTFQLTIGAKSGFRRFFDHFNDMESKEHGVYVFELKEQEDILRSGLLRWVMTKVGVIPRKAEPIGAPGDWVPGS